MRLLTFALSRQSGGTVNRPFSVRRHWLLPLGTVGIIGIGCGSSGNPGTTVAFDSGVHHHDSSTGHVEDTGTLHGGGMDVSLPDACATTSKTATVSPLDMVLLLDRSASMGDNNSWTEEIEALTQFVQDGRSAGIGVGIQYMPLEDLCNPSAYADPAVAVSLLPQGAGGIITSLSNSRPFGGTPTVVALEGALSIAKARKEAYPARDVVVVFTTDAIPYDSCLVVPEGGLPNTTQNAVAVLQAAAQATPPIKTFVIGVGHQAMLANELAAAGGTSQAILVGAGDAGTTVDIEGPLISALNSIRTTAIPCEYAIPTPEAGTIDPQDVNVTFTPSPNNPQQFYGVGSASSCTTTSSDWYYDNPSNPTHIELCPTACTEVKASTDGNLSIAYGCATIPPPK
jgi:hypothetical protein